MYLVTGASGFVGRHLLAILAPWARAHGQRLLVLCRRRAQWHAQPWTAALRDVEVVEGDVTSVDGWSGRLPPHKLAGVFHLAAVVKHSRHDAQAACAINVEGTRQIVALARTQGARCVFLSTSGTVGCSTRPEDAPDESAPFCHQQVQRWPYYASKIAAERVARTLAPRPQALVIVRPPVILGPEDHRFRSSGLIVRLLRGRLPFILPGGMHFVDVRDVAAALLGCMLLPAPAPIYHLPGHASSLRSFFAHVALLAGARAPRVVLRPSLARALARCDARLGRLVGKEALHLFVDEVVVEMGCAFWGLSSRVAAQDLNFVARPAAETLAATIGWLRQVRRDCGATTAPPA